MKMSIKTMCEVGDFVKMRAVNGQKAVKSRTVEKHGAAFLKALAARIQIASHMMPPILKISLYSLYSNPSGSTRTG